MSVGQEAQPLLDVRNATMSFGGVTALKDVSLSIDTGRIVGLIGPNGAGKTTLFNLVSGYHRPTGGEIVFAGRSLPGTSRHRITRLGIARTFQNLRVFDRMTARENVLVGADAHHRTGFLNAVLRLPRHRREERQGRALADELLEMVGLADRADELAANLSYGEQRRLEIVRALATGPRLLLLDEPAAGSNPVEKERLAELIRDIRERGHTIVVIEHDMGMVMDVCDEITVLDFGVVIARGTPAEIQRDPAVIEAYLGSGQAAKEAQS
ncbi:MAG: ATP-binding cassette domain-containing protein [Streptosporangiales bacterium]|nr:ATP-binding cassette domain-containing protein [Streptosporangiales bacterium]